jgi:CheY-like chemotaxis protein
MIPVSAGHGRHILVVEDDPTSLAVIEALLCNEHRVTAVADGAAAVERAARGDIDLVIMDIHIPGMNGYEATTAIKKGCGERFLPVMFMTASNNEELLARGIAAGGDDVLIKPIGGRLLLAKVEALLRTGDLLARVRAQKERLALFRAEADRDYGIARRILDTVVTRGDLRKLPFESLDQPLERFSGDLMMATHLSPRRLRVFAGDFSGHGLAAAVGAMPVSDAFYTLSAEGLPIEAIIRDVNDRLRRILARGQFLSACVLDLDLETGELLAWNGGMPAPLVCGEGTIRRIASHNVPLGVEHDLDPTTWRTVLVPGQRLLLHTDGVTEATNPHGELYGDERLEEVLRQVPADGDAVAAVARSLAAFREDSAPRDDTTMLGLKFDEPLRRAVRALGAGPREDERKELSLDLLLDAELLRSADPAAPVMAMLRTWPALPPEPEALFTVIVQLVANALDHGVLGLDPTLESEELRRRRALTIGALRCGWVRVQLEVTSAEGRRAARLRVESGGTDRAPPEAPGGQGLMGSRALELVRGLCSQVSPLEGGRVIEARLPLTGTRLTRAA